MTIGSLCSGIGGLELGLERAWGARTVWQAEVDPHASAVLARHWPGVPNLGNVRDVGWLDDRLGYGDGITRSLHVDVICAGYPCQPFSHAGQRGGTDDPRHLWPSVRDAIRDLGPHLVVLENVRGHLSLGFGDVLGDLADLGFDAEWRLLRASDVGGCHPRARLFVAARRRDAPDPLSERLEGTEPEPEPRMPARVGALAGNEGRPAAADADPQGLEGHGRPVGSPERLPAEGHPADSAFEWGRYAAAVARWEHHLGRAAPAPTVGRRLNPALVEWMMGFPEGWVDGLSYTAALRCLGNAVVPQVAEMFGRMADPPARHP